MFGYMTDLSTVDETKTEEITAQGISYYLASRYRDVLIIYMTLSLTGEDLESLLFHFLDEFLFTFSADPFFIPKVCVFVTLCPLYCSTVDNHISLSHHSYCSESKNH